MTAETESSSVTAAVAAKGQFATTIACCQIIAGR